MQFRFGFIPSSGFVATKPSLLAFSLPRMISLLSAGLFAEGLAMWGACKWLRAMPTRPSSFTTYCLGYCLVCVLIFGVIHFIDNLIPQNGLVDGNELPTDGKQLLQLWQRRHQRAAERAFALEAAPLNARLIARDYLAALPLAQKLAARHPDRIDLCMTLFSIYNELGDTENALEIGLKVVATPGLSSKQAATMFDNLSCLPLYNGRHDLLARAETWITEALRLDPDAITFKGTRGGLLVELGRLEEGTEMLRQVVAQSDSLLDQGISLAYLAKAAAAQGQHQEARIALIKAQQLQPDHCVIKRITGEIEPTKTDEKIA